MVLCAAVPMRPGRRIVLLYSKLKLFIGKTDSIDSDADELIHSSSLRQESDGEIDKKTKTQCGTITFG